ncbi:MAG: 4a-hydroxytetrahydrobiopterin dehydratase [Ahrensia sp.]|nr:4a-hydroxytetrahydrobiopterin dehydratase [Ahrensia sp.]
MAELLSDEARERALSGLDDWDGSSGKSIAKTFRFETFAQAFGFMATIAVIAEKMDHHPDWTNVYNRVEVTLSTHDKGGVTQLDIDLAAAMNAAAS